MDGYTDGVDGAPAETRAGYVALVGRPNVGKSTLLNAFTGEHLSIVTPRAQTTRERVLGIYTDEAVQMVFVDTPGLLEPKYLLQRGMLDVALGAVGDADVTLLLLDASRPAELPDAAALEQVRAAARQLVVAVNKVDVGDPATVAELERWASETLGADVVRISAATGEGVDRLRSELARRLPASPFLFPPEDLAVQPVRFFVQELVRETIFEQYAEEIPYSTVVRIEEFRESEDPVYVRATIFVERGTQKMILIGKGGMAIKELGRVARAKIESFLGTRVYLDLWVKVMPGWRRKAASLRHLGYHVPEDVT